MKRKLITFTLLFSLLFGSANIYAATALDTNLLNIIKSGMLSIKQYYYALTDQNTNTTEQKYIANTQQIVNTKSQNAIEDIEQHQKNEVARADRELHQYVDQLDKEVEAQIQAETSIIKNGLTEKVNQSIEKAKQDIAKEFEKQLGEKLKK